MVVLDARPAGRGGRLARDRRPAARALIATYRPDVVCIDSPPAWAPSGERSRTTERRAPAARDPGVLHARPARRARRTRSTTGCATAIAAFRAADRAGFPRVPAPAPIAGHAIEVFPHASATVLAGCLRRRASRLGQARLAAAGAARAPRADGAAPHAGPGRRRARRADRPRRRSSSATRSRPGVPKEGRIVAARARRAARPGTVGARRPAPTDDRAADPVLRLRVRRARCAPAGSSGRATTAADGPAGARGRRRRPRASRSSSGGAGRDRRTHRETRAIHAGQDPDALYGAVNVPIYQNSTYAQADVAEPKVLGLRARRQPDPRGVPARARRARGRRARASRSPAGWPPRPRCC